MALSSRTLTTRPLAPAQAGKHTGSYQAKAPRTHPTAYDPSPPFQVFKQLNDPQALQQALEPAEDEEDHSSPAGGPCRQWRRAQATKLGVRSREAPKALLSLLCEPGTAPPSHAETRALPASGSAALRRLAGQLLAAQSVDVKVRWSLGHHLLAVLGEGIARDPLELELS